MATERQRSAARRNIKKATSAAKRSRTISKLPSKTRSALGKQGAKARGRSGRGSSHSSGSHASM
jgi:hypothetical protein